MLAKGLGLKRMREEEEKESGVKEAKHPKHHAAETVSVPCTLVTDTCLTPKTSKENDKEKGSVHHCIH